MTKLVNRRPAGGRSRRYRPAIPAPVRQHSSAAAQSALARALTHCVCRPHTNPQTHPRNHTQKVHSQSSATGCKQVALASLSCTAAAVRLRPPRFGIAVRVDNSGKLPKGSRAAAPAGRRQHSQPAAATHDTGLWSFVNSQTGPTSLTPKTTPIS